MNVVWSAVFPCWSSFSFFFFASIPSSHLITLRLSRLFSVLNSFSSLLPLLWSVRWSGELFVDAVYSNFIISSPFSMKKNAQFSTYCIHWSISVKKFIFSQIASFTQRWWNFVHKKNKMRCISNFFFSTNFFTSAVSFPAQLTVWLCFQPFSSVSLLLSVLFPRRMGILLNSALRYCETRNDDDLSFQSVI